VGLIRVGTRVAERAPLPEQVPATIELDLDVAQTLLVGLECVVVGCVRLLAVAKLVLLGNEVFDSRRDAFVAHASSVRHA